MFVVLAVVMLMFSYVLATSYALNVPQEKKDSGITIDSKVKKVISYKIT